MSLRRLYWLVGLLLISLLSACTSLAPVEDGENTTSFEGPPGVSIASPLAGDTYEEGVNVSILVRVTNAGDDIGRVALQVDGQIIAERTQPNPEGVASFVIESGWVAQGDGAHTISAVVSRLDGVTSNQASVEINVRGEPSPTPMPTIDATPTPTNTLAPTSTNIPSGPPPSEQGNNGSETTGETDGGSTFGQQPAATNTPAPTNTPAATNTPTQPRVRVDVGANVRGGAGTVFGAIGSLAAGEEANILAVNPAGDWYKIQYYNGEGWIFNGVVTVLGDTSRLPRDAGPPTPVPATATPVPPTAEPTSSSAPDLSIVQLTINPNPPRCGESIEIIARIVNTGTAASAGARITVQDLRGGQEQASGETVVGGLGINEAADTFAYIQVSTFVAEEHVIRVRVDADNQVSETNEDNNTRDFTYTLASGAC